MRDPARQEERGLLRIAYVYATWAEKIAGVVERHQQYNYAAQQIDGIDARANARRRFTAARNRRFLGCFEPDGHGPGSRTSANQWIWRSKVDFQMADNGDLHEQILHIEAHLEELTDTIEGCRKIILISKAAIAAGVIGILGIIAGAVRFDPTVLIGAIAAVVGGMVIVGSNMSTLKQSVTEIKAAETRRAELIGRMELKVVGGGRVES